MGKLSTCLAQPRILPWQDNMTKYELNLQVFRNAQQESKQTNTLKSGLLAHKIQFCLIVFLYLFAKRIITQFFWPTPKSFLTPVMMKKINYPVSRCLAI